MCCSVPPTSIHSFRRDVMSLNKINTKLWKEQGHSVQLAYGYPTKCQDVVDAKRI